MEIAYDAPKFSLCSCFPKILEGDIHALGRDVTVAKIKNALFQMAPFKAPGIDGL